MKPAVEEVNSGAVLPGGVREAARQMGISVAVAYRAARNGDIPAVRISPKRWIIPRKAWEKFLEGD